MSLAVPSARGAHAAPSQDYLYCKGAGTFPGMGDLLISFPEGGGCIRRALRGTLTAIELKAVMFPAGLNAVAAAPPLLAPPAPKQPARHSPALKIYLQNARGECKF